MSSLPTSKKTSSYKQLKVATIICLQNWILSYFLTVVFSSLFTLAMLFLLAIIKLQIHLVVHYYAIIILWYILYHINYKLKSSHWSKLYGFFFGNTTGFIQFSNTILKYCITVNLLDTIIKCVFSSVYLHDRKGRVCLLNTLGKQ